MFQILGPKLLQCRPSELRQSRCLSLSSRFFKSSSDVDDVTTKAATDGHKNVDIKNQRTDYIDDNPEIQKILRDLYDEPTDQSGVLAAFLKS